MSHPRDSDSPGYYAIPPGGVDRIPEYDPRKREHFWSTMVLFRISDPRRMCDEPGGMILDRENLMLAGPVGCFHCERPYRRGAERFPCPGDPED